MLNLRVTVCGGLLLRQLRASYKYAILLRVPFLREDSGAQVLGGLIFHNWFLPILYLQGGIQLHGHYYRSG